MSDTRWWQPLETCREWVKAKADRCNEPAAFILWGQLFDKSMLGPRCMDHSRDCFDVHRADQYAVFDLRRVGVVS